MSHCSLESLPIIHDKTPSKALPHGAIYTSPFPERFKNRYANGEWATNVAKLMFGNPLADLVKALRKKLGDTCRSMRSARARRGMWLALELNGHSWLDNTLSGLNSNIRREADAVNTGPMAQTPENLVFIFERAVRTEMALIEHETLILCDESLYDGKLQPDEVVDKLRKVRGPGKILRGIISHVYGIRIPLEQDWLNKDGSLADVIEGNNTISAIVAEKKKSETESAVQYSEWDGRYSESSRSILTMIRQHVANGHTLNPGSLTRMLRSQPGIKKVTLSEKDGFNIYIEIGCHNGRSFDDLLRNLLASGCGLRFPNLGGRSSWPGNFEVSRMLFDLPLPTCSQDGEFSCEPLTQVRTQAREMSEQNAFSEWFFACYAGEARVALINAMRVEIGGRWDDADEVIPKRWHECKFKDRSEEDRNHILDILADAMISNLEEVASLYESAVEFEEKLAEDFAEIIENDELTIEKAITHKGITLQSIWVKNAEEDMRDHYRERAISAGYIRRVVTSDINEFF